MSSTGTSADEQQPDQIGGRRGSRFRVVDFSTHLSGPLAGRILAELGANVIKVENPRHGDGNRELPPRAHGESLWHAFFSSGARSIACDRRSEEWPLLVRAAAAWADAVIVSDSVAVLRERGLDFDTLAAANDRLVYCMLPAYGNVGPWRALPAHGLNIDFAAGNGVVEEDAGGGLRPLSQWRPLGSGSAAVFAALAVMDGLARRSFEQRAVCLEVSLWRAAVWSQWRDMLPVANGVGWDGLVELGPRYAIYRTKDDRFFQIAAIEEKFWRRFCEIAELPTEVADRGEWKNARMDYGAAYPEESLMIQERIARRDLAFWVDACSSSGVPAAPLLLRGEVIGSEHARAEQAFGRVASREADATFVVPRIPIKRFGEEEPAIDEVQAAAPRIGEHGHEIRELWGLG